MAHENLNEPPKGQFSNSIFLLTIFGPIVSVLAYIGLLWLSNAVLSPDDAKPVKEALGVILGLTGAATAAGGPVGLIVRSLMLTQGKIKAQLPAVPETQNAGTIINEVPKVEGEEFSAQQSPHELEPRYDEGSASIYDENENIEVIRDAGN